MIRRRIILKHEFVEFIPDNLEERTIYISIPYATATHKCPCGCGERVVTPITPTDWQLTFDGQSVSLYPSIGNWNFRCQSHYWIERSRIEWARRWSQREIDREREVDLRAKGNYYREATRVEATDYPQEDFDSKKQRLRSLVEKLRSWLLGRRR